jgi:hypothetical protein
MWTLFNELKCGKFSRRKMQIYFIKLQMLPFMLLFLIEFYSKKTLGQDDYIIEKRQIILNNT